MKHHKHVCQVGNFENPNTKKFWNEKIAISGENLLKSPIYIQKNKWIVKAIENISGKLLDVGIGYGYLEELIVKNKLNFQLNGVDISNYAINSASKKFDGVFKVAGVDKIPFADNIFDCVLALDVLEHIPTVKLPEALLEMNRVLKKGGMFIVSVPLNESKIDKIMNGHLKEFNTDTIKSEIQKAEFLVTKIKYLYAFRSLVLVKNLINNIFKIKLPNLVILISHKI
ncbi:MAG: hypothetical protein ACD_19C00079G0037 [uncultured bacterium]|nr:MAG: hypothetical protein ACD_19C00079G0037 [uncultured bacterium]